MAHSYLLNLKGHTGPVTSVSFSPDGKRLASASRDKTVKVWDARPWTPELRAAQEALGDVRFLSEKPLTKDEMISAITTDATLSEPVRQRAIEFAGQNPENAEAFNNACWIVVSKPDQPPEQYSRALRDAEAASRLKPEVGSILNTLGIAQYRVGQFEQALQTLTRSSSLNQTQLGRPHPADVAFLSMTHHRLGHTDEARKLLEQLRQLLQQDPWKTDSESQAFLREAESLIEPPPGDTEPPPPPLPAPIP